MEHDATTSEKTRLIQLDILRGIAILLVIGRHVYLQPPYSGSLQPFTRYWFDFGWTGVDLFFVLSGFLVGGLLFKEWRLRSALDVKRFLIRRGYKIWPPYVIYIIFVTIWYIFVEQPGPVSRVLLLISPNFLHLQSYVLTPMVHTWSLAVEEHFYLLLPFIILHAAHAWHHPERPVLKFSIIIVIVAALLLGIKASLQRFLPPESMPPEMKLYLLPYLTPFFLYFFGAQLLILAALFLFLPYVRRREEISLSALPIIAISVMVICLVFRVSSAWLSPRLNTIWTFTFFSTHLRIDSLFFGVLLSYLYHFKPAMLERIGKHRIILAIIGTVTVVLAILNPIAGAFSQLIFSFLYLGYGCLLLALLYTNLEGIGGKILKSFPARVLALIGYFSYSIYLWHVNPARYLAEGWFIEKLKPHLSAEALWLVATTVYVVVVILFGALMSKLIEVPSLKLRDKLFPPRADALERQEREPVEHTVSDAIAPVS